MRVTRTMTPAEYVDRQMRGERILIVHGPRRQAEFREKVRREIARRAEEQGELVTLCSDVLDKAVSDARAAGVEI